LLLFLRISVVIVLSSSGYVLGSGSGMSVQGLLAGLAIGILSIVSAHLLKGISMGPIICGMVGLFLGLLSARLLLVPFRGVVDTELSYAYFALAAVLGYGGLMLGVKKGEKLTLPTIARHLKGHEGDEKYRKILDTSVIIDGRIADICETGFLDGEFLVPQFILQELQHIADSPDAMKRARGRRGLDVLHRIQKMPQINVKIVERDFPKIREVDSKLVALGKVLDAKVVTNDFNLNKVAELQGVSVLNINELSNAIKPVVLPGEIIRVFVIKEGKEQNQGVAYLEDGTMIVIDNGKRFIGKNVEVAVTSVLQTTAGRMIFTKTKEEYEKEARASK
jgi:uncharacterized protein YacL